MQVVQYGARHLEGAPHPVRRRGASLNLNLANAAHVVADNGVEQLRAIYGESQKGEPVIGQLVQSVFGQPDRIGEADQYPIIAMDQRQSAKDRITQASRL